MVSSPQRQPFYIAAMKHTLKFKESIDISAGRLNTWAGFNSFTQQITPQGLAVWPFDFKSPNLGHDWLRLRLAIALQSLWNTGSPWTSRCRTTTLVKVQQTGPQSLDVSRRFFSLTQELIAWQLSYTLLELRSSMQVWHSWSWPMSSQRVWNVINWERKDTYIEYHRITFFLQIHNWIQGTNAVG